MRGLSYRRFGWLLILEFDVWLVGGLRFSAIFLICLLVELRFSPAGESLFFQQQKKSNQPLVLKRMP